MSGLDALLHHLVEDDFESFGPDDHAKRPPPPVLPALVRLPREDFVLPAIAGFREDARVSNVVSGAGTDQALRDLAALPGVVVELSRGVGRHAWEVFETVETVRGRDVAAPGGDPESRCLVALIDGGIDVRHQAFLAADGSCRVLAIWDQTCSLGVTPEAALGLPLPYGTVHSAADIAAAIAAKVDLPGLTKMDQKELEHGTHVASIAAGRRVPGFDHDPTLFGGGMAPDAPIVMVVPKLSASPHDPQSIGYSKGHVDALSFIERVAETHGIEAIVVNLSAGMMAGAHDGSSTLEAAFDAFTMGGRAPGRAIVKSAGNARMASQHARVTVPQNGTRTVHVASPAGAQGTVLVEAWFSSASLLEVVVQDGNGLKAAACSATRPRPASVDLLGGAVHRSYERFHGDNGESQVLVTLPAGHAFSIKLAGVALQGHGLVDLWVEGPATLSDAVSDGTLTVPGTARTVITVGASDRAGEEIHGSSSAGPTRDGRQKPELWAPGVNIHAAKSGSGRGRLSLTGTSMAAPHVTGAIARLFSMHVRLQKRVPNAVQVRAALIASVQNGSAFNPEGGHGLLDVKGLIAAFASWRTP